MADNDLRNTSRKIKPWTNAEVAFLRDNASRGAPWIARELGRSVAAVRVRACDLKISLWSRSYARSPDDRLRWRWSLLIGPMKEALRRDLGA